MVIRQATMVMVQKDSIKEQKSEVIGFIVILKQIARAKFTAQYWKLAVFKGVFIS